MRRAGRLPKSSDRWGRSASVLSPTGCGCAMSGVSSKAAGRPWTYWQKYQYCIYNRPFASKSNIWTYARGDTPAKRGFVYHGWGHPTVKECPIGPLLPRGEDNDCLVGGVERLSRSVYQGFYCISEYEIILPVGYQRSHGTRTAFLRAHL